MAGYYLPRRWSYRAPGMFLACRPWDGDRRLRLVRNDGRLWFPEGEHAGARCDPPTRIAGAPIIHLALLVNDETARRARVSQSEDRHADAPAAEGRSLRRIYDLPEDSPAVTVAAIAEADALRIQKILASLGARQAPASRLPVVPADEVEQWWPGRSFSESDYSARMQARPLPSPVAAESNMMLDVEVTNTGGHVWPASALDHSGHPVKLCYHWKHKDGSTAVWDGLRSSLPCRLIPGSSATVELRLEYPEGTRGLPVMPRPGSRGCPLVRPRSGGASHRSAASRPLGPCPPTLFLDGRRSGGID